MKPSLPRQVKLRVEPELKAQVKRYCAAHGCTEQALMRTALEQYLTGTNDRALLMRRLDRISQDVQELVAANVSLGEAFGTFVQMWFGHHPEIPEGRKEEARRDAGRRYRAFLQHVVRTIGDGRTLIGQLTGGGEPRGPLAERDEVQP
jgi:hypothetical protein